MAPSVGSFNRYSVYDFRNFCAITQMNPDGTKREPKPEPRDNRHVSAAKYNIRDRATGFVEVVE